MRELRPRQREALDLFRSFREITSMQLAEALSISARQARELCLRWVADGFLVIENPSKRARSYRLDERWESVVTKRR